MRNYSSIISPPEITLTGSGGSFIIEHSGAELVRANTSGDYFIAGIKPGYPGQRITFAAVGSGNIYFAHQSASASANERLINYVTNSTSNTPISSKGSCTYQYDSVSARWRLIQHEQGSPISVPFVAGNFTANGAMTWTVASGDQVQYAYLLRANIVEFYFQIDTTTVGGTPNTLLQVTLPNAFIIATTAIYPCQAIDNNTPGQGLMVFSPATSTTKVSFTKDNAVSNWSAATDTTYIRATGSCQVT